MPLQAVAYANRRVFPSQLCTRDVNVHGECLCFGNFAPPERELPAGLIKNPVAHGNNQSCFFRNRYKVARRNETAFWMPPSDECLKPDQLAGTKGNLRLVMDNELLFLH